MKRFFFSLGILTIVSTHIFAQDAEVSEAHVQYDPLFWKDKLKLDADQCLKIKEINGEYYKSLFTAHEDVKNNHDALRSIADKSLEQRNQEIWETFHPKQRKRWRRMWNASTPQALRNES